MSATSRRKGASGEREFSEAVRARNGVRLVRRLDQCRGGGHDLDADPDEDSPAAQTIRQYAIECKRYRTATDADIALWWR